jgi:hypothetical protein
MELAIAIAANVVLGCALLGLFAWNGGRDPPRLAGPEEALRIYREQFPDAEGAATVAAGGSAALIALRRGSIGVLHRHGNRWNARELQAEDLGAVTLAREDTIALAFRDFGWPRARFRIADPQLRARWLSRLGALVPTRV